MAISLYTVTGNAADVLGGNFDPRRVKVVVSTNLPRGTAPVDLEHNRVLLGASVVWPQSDGSFTIPNLVGFASTDVNPTGIQYKIDLVYVDAASRQEGVVSSGWVSITADADLADLVAEQYAPPNYQSAFLEQAEAIRDQQVELSGIDSSDTATAYNIAHGTATAPALADAIADSIVPGETDPQVAVDERAQRETRTDLRDDTASHAAGAPSGFTSGQPLTTFGNAALTINASGYYTHTPAAVVNSAGYVQADMGPLTPDHDGIYHIGADVCWPTNDVAAVALVLSDGAWTDTPSPVRSRAKVHGVFYGNGIMHVSDFNSGETKYMDTGAATTAVENIPRFADVRSSNAFRRLDIQFDPDTGTITVVRPDGSSVTKTVAVLIGFKPRYAIWELFEPGASTPASARFKNMRASVGPRKVGDRTATRGDVGRIVNSAPVPAQLLKSRRAYRPSSTETINLPITTAAEILGTGSAQITRLSAVVPPSGKLQARVRAYITTATARAVFLNLVNTDDGSTIDSHRVIDGSEATGARWIDESFDISGMTPGITRSVAFYAVIGSGTASDVTITAGQNPSRQVEVELTPVN